MPTSCACHCKNDRTRWARACSRQTAPSHGARQRLANLGEGAQVLGEGACDVGGNLTPRQRRPAPCHRARDPLAPALRPVRVQRPKRPRPPAPRRAPRAHRRNDVRPRWLRPRPRTGRRSAGTAMAWAAQPSCSWHSTGVPLRNRGWQRGWCDYALASSWVCACERVSSGACVRTQAETWTLAGSDGVARDALAGYPAQLGGRLMLEHGQWESAAVRVVLARHDRRICRRVHYGRSVGTTTMTPV